MYYNNHNQVLQYIYQHLEDPGAYVCFWFQDSNFTWLDSSLLELKTAPVDDFFRRL